MRAGLHNQSILLFNEHPVDSQQSVSNQQVSVILRYPHVRLAMLNRLAAGGDCDTAFLETAEALGFEVPVLQHNHNGNECATLQSAQAILQTIAPARAEGLFKELIGEVEQYQKQFKGKTLSPMRMRTKDKCDGMGAIVMDLLLQIIEAESLEVERLQPIK